MCLQEVTVIVASKMLVPVRFWLFKINQVVKETADTVGLSNLAQLNKKGNIYIHSVPKCAQCAICPFLLAVSLLAVNGISAFPLQTHRMYEHIFMTILSFPQ